MTRVIGASSAGRLGSVALRWGVWMFTASVSLSACRPVPPIPEPVRPSPGGAPTLVTSTYIPAFYESNIGQGSREAAFIFRPDWGTIEARREGLVLSVPSGGITPSFDPTGRAAGREPARPGKPLILRLLFDGPASSVAPEGRQIQAARANHYAGRNKDQWWTGIPLYGEVQYRGLSAGIDFVLTSHRGEPGFEYRLEPGRRLSDCGLRVEGARALSLDKAGNLEIGLDSSRVILTAPRFEAREETSGKRRSLAGGFRLEGNRIGFECQELRALESLVIDPQIVFGYTGHWWESLTAWRVASPTAEAVYTGDQGGNGDSFVRRIRIDPQGMPVLEFETSIDGFRLYSITADRDGRFYCAGGVWSNGPGMPIVGPAFLTSGSGHGIISFRPGDGQIDHSTYFGDPGTRTEALLFSAMLLEDAAGGIVLGIGGEMKSHSDPPAASYHGPLGLSPAPLAGQWDGFMAGLSSDLTTLRWFRFIGGSGDDFSVNMTAGGGRFYQLGVTNSRDLAVTPGAAQSTFGTGFGSPAPPPGSEDEWDLYVTASDADGQLDYCTYVGARNRDYAGGIGVSSSGEVVVAAQLNYPAWKAVVIRLLPDGSAVRSVQEYPTGVFFSGLSRGIGGREVPPWAEVSTQVGLLPDGRAVLTPSILAPDAIGISSDAFDSTVESLECIYSLATPEGSFEYHSYLGGSGWEEAYCLSVDPQGSVWIAGDTDSPDFPSTIPPSSPQSGNQSFLVKIQNPPAEPSRDMTLMMGGNPESVVAGDIVNYRLTVTNLGPGEATGCRVTDELPATLQVVDMSPPGTVNGQQVTIPLGTMAFASGKVVNISARTTVPGTYENRAHLLCGTATNVVASATTTVLAPPAVLSLDIQDSPDPALRGQTVSYSIRVTNIGPFRASGAWLVVDRAPEMEFTMIPPEALNNGDRIKLPLPDLDPGQFVEKSFGAVSWTPGTWTNRAETSGNDVTPTREIETTTILPGFATADLVLNVIPPTPSTAHLGQLFETDVRVRNIGSVPAAHVLVTGHFDPGKNARVEWLSDPGAAFDAAGVRWPLGPVLAGADLHLRVRARAQSVGPITFKATATSTSLPSPGLTAESEITVQGHDADLRVGFVGPPTVADQARKWSILIDEMNGQRGPFGPMTITVEFQADGLSPAQARDNIHLSVPGSGYPAFVDQVHGTTNRWVIREIIDGRLTVPLEVTLRAPQAYALNHLHATLTCPEVNEPTGNNEAWQP